MRNIGVDLAWGAKNTTAAVVLECAGQEPAHGARYLAHDDALTNNDSIADFIAEWDSGEGVFVAVDAPTLVPNETGRRPCEDQLSRCMRKYEAGPHPANRTLLSDANGEIRGETLVALLQERFGIAHTPYFSGSAPRVAFEVFPHPAHVVLFGLEKTVKYKKKPGRDRAFRDAELRRYTRYLQSLAAADPPLLVNPESVPWLYTDPASFLTEAGLKRQEDLLDALTCAYIALHRHRWQNTKSIVLGDMQHGYIVIPANDTIKQCFSELVRSGKSEVQ